MISYYGNHNIQQQQNKQLELELELEELVEEPVRVVDKNLFVNPFYTVYFRLRGLLPGLIGEHVDFGPHGHLNSREPAADLTGRSSAWQSV